MYFNITVAERDHLYQAEENVTDVTTCVLLQFPFVLKGLIMKHAQSCFAKKRHALPTQKRITKHTVN